MSRIKKPGAGPSSRLSRRDVLRAARRHFIEGQTQSAIARDMGISPSYLARLLKRAQADGLVRIYVDSDRQTELEAELQARYPNLVHVEVVPSGPTPEHTARAIGHAQARWLNDLLDADEESGEPKINNIAIGGAWPHHFLVEAVAPRPNRISVGPTALTPLLGRAERFTAPTLAAMLALKLGALTAGSSDPAGRGRTGFLYTGSLSPPMGSAAELRSWFQRLREDPNYLQVEEFWRQVDVAFISGVGLAHIYNDVGARFARYGIDIGILKERGAAILAGNRIYTSAGELLELAPGVDSYEATMEFPTDAPAARDAPDARAGLLVLDAWGQFGASALALATVPTAKALFTDTTAAVAHLSP